MTGKTSANTMPFHIDGTAMQVHDESGDGHAGLRGGGTDGEDRSAGLLCPKGRGQQGGDGQREADAAEEMCHGSLERNRSSPKNGSTGSQPRTMPATYSPKAGPFLNPCPEPPPTSQTFAA